MIIHVQASHDKKFPLEVEGTETAVDLKARISSVQDVPAEEIRLIFSGRILKDTDTVESLRMADGNAVHMVRSAKAKPAGGTASTTAASPATAGSTTSTTGQTAGTNFPTTGRPLQTSPSSMAQMMASLAVADGARGGVDSANNSMMAALLNNPEMMRQSLEVVVANPQLLQAVMQMNPAYQNAPPHVQQLMQRPEFLRMVMEMTLAQAQTQGPQGSASPLGTPPTGASGGGEGENPDAGQYMQTFEALLGGGDQPQNLASNEPPEVRFQTQLQQLSEMGFYDSEANIRALLATGGNVNLAIERLLQNM